MYWISVNPFAKIATEKLSCGRDRTAVPSDGKFLRSERSTTELAGPGFDIIYEQILKLFLLSF